MKIARIAACLALAALSVAPASTPGQAFLPLARHAAVQSGPYGPADLRAAYGIPASTTRATVAVVVAYDAPDIAVDNAAYRAAYGLPACTGRCFRKVNQQGARSPLPGVNTQWASEATLDVDMVSAICPTCRILLVEADSDDRGGRPDLQTAVRAATDLGARYVSMSWGMAETPAELGYDRTYLDARRTVYVAAAGDGGYATGWPAASPRVISVGGTSLRRAPGTHRGWTETAWSVRSTLGTGSGCSLYEPRPAWQDSAVTGCATRALNDVAVVGSEAPGVYVVQGGRWFAMGGTSAGAPIVAAMAAIAGATSGPAYLYAHRGDFRDLRRGATAACGSVLCRSARGWDGPTGLGSPAGVGGL